MPREDIETRFRSAEERDRFRRLVQDRGLHTCFTGGVVTGDTTIAPSIRRGEYGLTEAEIRDRIERVVRAARKSSRGGPNGTRMTRDELFCWRIGFEAAAFEAMDGLLGELERTTPAAPVG